MLAIADYWQVIWINLGNIVAWYAIPWNYLDAFDHLTIDQENHAYPEIFYFVLYRVQPITIPQFEANKKIF